MPTPSQAFAAVAAALAGVDPGDNAAVESFFRRSYLKYPPPVMALISDFLTGLTGMPTAESLNRLKQAVALPASEVPEIEAPAWDDKYGPPMEYQVSNAPKTAIAPRTPERGEVSVTLY